MENAIASQHLNTVKLLMPRLSAPLNLICSLAVISGNENTIEYFVCADLSSIYGHLISLGGARSEP